VAAECGNSLSVKDFNIDCGVLNSEYDGGNDDGFPAT
jgi:hypothetical protein